MKTTATITLALLGWIATPVLAGEKVELKRFIAAHEAFHAQKSKRAKDQAPRCLAQAIRNLLAAAMQLNDPAAKEAVIDDLRGCLKNRSIEVRIAAIVGYGAMAVPGSSRDLRPYADKKRNKRHPHEITLAALGAWGCIADPGTHGVLLAYIRVPSRHKERLELSAPVVIPAFVRGATALHCRGEDFNLVLCGHARSSLRVRARDGHDLLSLYVASQ